VLAGSLHSAVEGSPRTLPSRALPDMVQSGMPRVPRHASEFDIPHASPLERVNPLRGYFDELTNWWQTKIGEPPSFPLALSTKITAHDAIGLRLHIQSLCYQRPPPFLAPPHDAANQNQTMPKFSVQASLDKVLSSIPARLVAWDASQHHGYWLSELLLHAIAGTSATAAQTLPLIGTLLELAPAEVLAKALPSASSVHPWVSGTENHWGYALLKFCSIMPVSEGFENLALCFMGSVLKVAQASSTLDVAEHWRIYLSHTVAIRAMYPELLGRDAVGWRDLRNSVQRLALPVPIHRPWQSLPHDKKTLTGPEWMGEPEVLLAFFAISAPISALSSPSAAGPAFESIKDAMKRRRALLSHWPKMNSFSQAQGWLEQRLALRSDPALMMAWKARLEDVALEQSVVQATSVLDQPGLTDAPVRRRI
jgi:hypothetical protein